MTRVSGIIIICMGGMNNEIKKILENFACVLPGKLFGGCLPDLSVAFWGSGLIAWGAGLVGYP